jgi:hydrogenase/urease accessory protein HupE
MVRAAAVLLGWLCSAICLAHPLGNNTINRLTAIHIAPRQLQLQYIMDLAEIPALMQTQRADANGDGTTSAAEWNVYAQSWAHDVSQHLNLELDGQRLAVELRRSTWSLVPGAAGLFTLRLEASFDAPVSPSLATLRYHDAYEPTHVGWKEISISADPGVRIQSNVAAIDRSKRLTQFPTGANIRLPQELNADASIAISATAIGAPLPSPRQTSVGTTARVSETASGRTSMWQSAGALFRLGIHHIATGWDHLAFLLGLLLLGQSLKELIKVVTAFTVAHSMTLALAANGWITPPGPVVESAIALTIAYVGFVSLVWRRSRHSALLAFSFGLVHGFGFAGALAESLGTHAALSGAWLLNLASFNLGIEAFQLVLICTLVPLIAYAVRYPWANVATRVASLGIFAAGVVWFIERAPQVFA